MDQQNYSVANDQLSFSDIVKIFRGKLKIIICITVIAAIIGSAAGIFMSQFSAVYGEEIDFYLNPGVNTQNLLRQFNSDAFAESLLLDNYRLPADWDKNDQEYKNALAAVKEEKAARDKVIEIDKKLSAFSYYVSTSESAPDYEKKTFNEVENTYKELLAAYEQNYKLLEVYKNAYDVAAGQPSHLEKTEEYEKAVAESKKELDSYIENFYAPKTAQKIALTDELSRARLDLKNKRETADSKVELVLSKWRQDPEVQKFVNTVRNSVTYKYSSVIDDESIKDPGSVEDAKENYNYYFLEIHVAVDNDEEAAELIVNKIKDRAPDLITYNLEKITGIAEAKCTLISPFAKPGDMSEASMIKNAVVYAAVAAVGAIGISCAVIFIKGLMPADVSEKKEKKNKKTEKA